MITLGQRDCLAKVLMADEALASHFDLSDGDNVRRRVKGISNEDCKDMHNFINYNHRFKLNGKMVELGFSRI